MGQLVNYLSTLKDNAGISKLGDDTKGYAVPGYGEIAGPVFTIRKKTGEFVFQLHTKSNMFEFYKDGTFSVFDTSLPRGSDPVASNLKTLGVM